MIAEVVALALLPAYEATFEKAVMRHYGQTLTAQEAYTIGYTSCEPLRNRGWKASCQAYVEVRDFSDEGKLEFGCTDQVLGAIDSHRRARITAANICGTALP